MLKLFLVSIASVALIGGAGCGTETKTVEYVPTEPSPGGGGSGGGGGGGSGGGEKLSYSLMADKMDQYCSACHASNGFMQNEEALRRSGVRDQLWSKSMPPNQNALPDRERQLMLSFF